MSIAAILGTARGQLEEAQQYARLYDAGTRAITIPARNGEPERVIDTGAEAARLARAARATSEDALARIQLDGGRGR